MPAFTLEQPPEVRSFLVIHQGALGDFILALPVLETLRKVFPRSTSTLIGYPRILELANNRFYADQVLSIDRKGMAPFFVQEGDLDPTLSDFFKRFELLVVFGKDGEGPLIHNLKKIGTGRILPIQSFPPREGKIHVTDHLLRELTRYGFPEAGKQPKLLLKESDRKWGEAFWAARGGAPKERSRRIILHPGSGSKKKVWPWQRFVELGSHLPKRLGATLLIVLGPAEGPEIQEAFETIEGVEPLFATGLSLVQIASVMEGCHLFVGNDSGISHMAAALGLPTLAIFGPTDPEVWSPRGGPVSIVYKKVPCSPCPPEQFSLCNSGECLKGIETEEVLEEIEKMGVI